MTNQRIPAQLDGRLAQGWGGAAPNGIHVNVILASRGSATAAALTTAFTSPTAGFTPILACLGAKQSEYQTVNPPTIIVNKSPIVTPIIEGLVYGAAQIGISQGVLDGVAETLFEANQETIIFVSLWIDPTATDRVAIKKAAREATISALREAVLGRPPKEATKLVETRDSVTHPFY